VLAGVAEGHQGEGSLEVAPVSGHRKGNLEDSGSGKIARPRGTQAPREKGTRGLLGAANGLPAVVPGVMRVVPRLTSCLKARG